MRFRRITSGYQPKIKEANVRQTLSNDSCTPHDCHTGQGSGRHLWSRERYFPNRFCLMRRFVRMSVLMRHSILTRVNLLFDRGVVPCK